VDGDDRVLRYVNAGHNPPLVLRRQGGLEWLESTGRPLGLLPGGGYEERRVELRTGDAVVLFTDGVTDMENEEGETFGAARLVSVLEQERRRGGDDLKTRVAETLQAFRGRKEPQDDATVVVLRLPPA
jgi:sigma-B regulation protein RsbU (phosphoserine phosphatase)